MTEALYTHNAYNIMYDSRQEMQAMYPRMGAEIRPGAVDLSEVQIPLLEPGTADGEKIMPLPKDPDKRVEYCKKMSHPRDKNPFFGKKHTQESLKKMSESHKGVVLSEEHKKKIGDSQRGMKRSEETCRRISESHKGKTRNPFSDEWKLKMSESHKGKLTGDKHPFYGTHLSEETKLKLSIKNKGQKRSEEFRRHISKRMTGERHPNWQGGISFEPYCIKFNDEFKERVRAFFGYRCLSPTCNYIWHDGEKKLSVHHVNFRKDSCCADDVIPLFVPLCGSCHSKTQFKKEEFGCYFTEIINRDFGGKCYFTKEEMEKYRERKKE